MEISRGVTCRTFTWRRKKPIFLSIFLYSFFIVSALVIPESVSFGPSLCFAYVFSMIQMLEVAVFMQSENILSSVLMFITLFTATIMPTMQMYQVMTGYYSKELGEQYGYLYMTKEIVLHAAAVFTSAKVVSISKIHSIIVVLIWICSETLFFILTTDELIYGYENLVCIARLTPQFYMATLTLVRMS
jgi:hypothetical protein